MYTKDFFFLNSLMNFVHFDAISKVGTRNVSETRLHIVLHELICKSEGSEP